MADASKTATTTKTTPVSVESGLAKSRATAFENPDETAVSIWNEMCRMTRMIFLID